jgi:hypothetical protein
MKNKLISSILGGLIGMHSQTFTSENPVQPEFTLIAICPRDQVKNILEGKKYDYHSWVEGTSITITRNITESIANQKSFYKQDGHWITVSSGGGQYRIFTPQNDSNYFENIPNKMILAQRKDVQEKEFLLQISAQNVSFHQDPDSRFNNLPPATKEQLKKDSASGHSWEQQVWDNLEQKKSLNKCVQYFSFIAIFGIFLYAFNKIPTQFSDFMHKLLPSKDFGKK